MVINKLQFKVINFKLDKLINLNPHGLNGTVVNHFEPFKSLYSGCRDQSLILTKSFGLRSRSIVCHLQSVQEIKLQTPEGFNISLGKYLFLETISID